MVTESQRQLRAVPRTVPGVSIQRAVGTSAHVGYELPCAGQGGPGARGWQATGGQLLDVDHTVPRMAWGLHSTWERDPERCVGALCTFLQACDTAVKVKK